MTEKSKNYKNNLKSDIIAGLTVALILVPKSIAYAQLAGLPAQYGLYASIFPPVVAALFGSSRHLATGPVAILSLMTASAVSMYYKPGTSEYISLALLIAFCLGVFQILLSAIKLGGAVSLLSHPVIYGFTNAAALIIASTQLPKFFGFDISPHGHQYETVITVLKEVSSGFDLITFLIGVWSLIAIITLKRIHKKFPSILVIVVVTTIFTWLLGYKGAIVGNVPSSLPYPAIPTLNIQMIIQLAPTIIIMGIVGFTEAISVAQAIAVKTKDRVEPNKELLGQGLANLIGSFFHSYPVSGSFSQTAINVHTGGKTALSSLITGIVVLLTLLFFTKLLYFIPEVVLAAVIVVSVLTLVDAKKFLHIWNTSKHDAIAALITFFTTLYFAPHLDRGIAVGVIFSIGYYIYKNVHPRVVFLSKYNDGWFHDATRFNLARCKNIAVVRFDGQLFFANSTYIENLIINDLIKHPEINDVLLMANGVNDIDSTGEHMLYSLWKTLKKNGKTLHISSLKSQITDVLERTGLKADIGYDNFLPTLDEAVKHIISMKENTNTHLDRGNCPLEKHVKATGVIKDMRLSKNNIIKYVYKKAIGETKNFLPQFSFLKTKNKPFN